MEEVEAIREEAQSIHAFLAELDKESWWLPTPFKGWTPFDVLAHLHLADGFAVLAATDPDAFARVVAQRRAAPQPPALQLPRESVSTREPTRMLADWRERLEQLCDALDRHEPKARLPWFGPDMAAARAAAARHMETWAHAQAVYDLLRRPRQHSDRIRFIADLGVRTFAWAFRNRGLSVPPARPLVKLAGPSGAVWEWTGAGTTVSVTGLAVEFCQVVAQVRHVQDTRLQVHGESAVRWMEIAQCFAGRPEDPPAPGQRAWTSGWVC